MSTDIIEVQASELATVPRDAPSVETMLMHAIDRGVDPAALEKLVALHERVQANRARSAFNQSIQAFKSECPPIGHSKNVDSGNGLKYSYTELPRLLEVIDPVLAKHGLSYSFDSVFEAESMSVICTVRHVDGHSEKSTFTSKISGTRAMSQAQMAGSAITFGRRYSLQMALGICTDADDDGRRAAPPPDNPDANPDAPNAQPRGKRVDPGELTIIFNAWKRKQKAIAGSDSKEALVNWASAVCSLECNSENVTKVTTWNRDAILAGMQDLKGYL